MGQGDLNSFKSYVQLVSKVFTKGTRGQNDSFLLYNIWWNSFYITEKKVNGMLWLF